MIPRRCRNEHNTLDTLLQFCNLYSHEPAANNGLENDRDNGITIFQTTFSVGLAHLFKFANDTGFDINHFEMALLESSESFLR